MKWKIRFKFKFIFRFVLIYGIYTVIFLERG